MADPEGNAIKTMAVTIAVRAAARWGLTLVPTLSLPAFSGDAVVFPLAGVVVEAGTPGAAGVEAFVKMAASGELGDMPRSSVLWPLPQRKVRNP